jgi:DMSO reductase family type II enzyme chaperone
MPTPSELLKNSPRRSIFGNYRSGSGSSGRESAPSDQYQLALAATSNQVTLQTAIDQAIARSFIYRYLAKAFEDGEVESWHWLTTEQTKVSLAAALTALGQQARALAQVLVPSAGESFANAYLACFGHTVRGDCPMNEIEYGDIKADPLFQPHRLSDLGAFYAAFGLTLTPDAAERIDHISIELEFMSVLAAKEAYAVERQFDSEQLELLRDAQKKFLREHLGRWTPAFTRRLARMADGTPLGLLAQLTAGFIRLECARFNVVPGSEDLLLRPVDEASESLCASCGITALPPGATATGPM